MQMIFLHARLNQIRSLYNRSPSLRQADAQITPLSIAPHLLLRLRERSRLL